jgi:hypothetical protein
MRAYMRSRDAGWTAMWCDKYSFPELAVQVIARDQIAALVAFMSRPYSEMAGRVHEVQFPFTHVERTLAGERYGEDREEVPPDADFACQVPAQREPSYYWWLQSPVRKLAEGRIDFLFGREGNVGDHVLDGWAKPEPKRQWMTHVISAFQLPMLQPDTDYELIAKAMPMLGGGAVRSQRLLIAVNQAVLAEFDVHQTMTIGFTLPRATLRRDGTDRLRLIHPDAISPKRAEGQGDGRVLAVSFTHLSLVPVVAW